MDCGMSSPDVSAVVVAMRARGFRVVDNGASRDLGLEMSDEGRKADAARVILAHIIQLDSQPASVKPALGSNPLVDLLNDVTRHGEADTTIRIAKDRGVDANDFSFRVD